MAHEVLGDLFFQTRRQPAWHGIMREGVDESREYTAAEVYNLFGNVDVRLVGLQSVAPRQDGSYLAIPYNAIVRGPVPSDPNPKVFGVVSPDYTLVTPSEVVDLWDSEVGRKLETMMFLRDGKLMVLTCKLEGFQVGGEEVESYCQIGNWMDGANASTALVSRVCTVCMNTWQQANDAAYDRYKFAHDAHIKHRMAAWFKDVLARAEGSTDEAKAVMEAMTIFRINKENVAAVGPTVLKAAYPTPTEPKKDKLDPPEVMERRQREYDALKHSIDIRRLAAYDLFRGQGAGMDLPTRRGTLWGLYQAVCEVEDYRKGSTGDGLASSILFGDRGATKDRAFKAAVGLLA